jgi:hypothetical protein
MTPAPEQLLATLIAFSDPSPSEGDTAFSRLSQEAQDLIVSAMLGEDPPDDSPESAQEEIRRWTEAEETESL